jgi:hypothetical protein
MLQADGAVLWAHRPPGGDFRNQEETFSVSADGTIIDFGFEGGQIPTPLRPARSQAVRSTARGWPHPAAKAGRAQDRRLGHLPYGVDARTPADLKASAISADEFHHKVAGLAKYGRVLVLLDACHSGGVTGDGSALTSNADLLRSIIAASNVTVLTSRIR